MTILISDSVDITRAVCNVKRDSSPKRLNNIVCAPKADLENI